MRWPLVSMLLLLNTAYASAQVIASCGPSTGQSYYLPGGVVGDGDAGWQEDGISSGGVQLLRDGSAFDIVYTDVAGSRSAKADGGTVIQLTAEQGYAVLVAYPQVIETYHFHPSRQLVWTQTKVSGLADKGAVFVSQCQ